MHKKCIQPLQPAERIITICPQMTVPPMNYAARSLRLRIPRICVSITGAEAAELLEKAETVLRENSLIELRLDYLKTPLSAMPRLRRLMEMRARRHRHSHLPAHRGRRQVPRLAGGRVGSAAQGGRSRLPRHGRGDRERRGHERRGLGRASRSAPPSCSPATTLRAPANWKRRLRGCARLPPIFTR